MRLEASQHYARLQKRRTLQAVELPASVPDVHMFEALRAHSGHQHDETLR